MIMKDFFKGKFATGVVVIATVILAGVAIFTALRLYQLRQVPVAPNAPTKPKAAALPVACQLLTFTLSENSPTITPTGFSATATLTPTAISTNTPTPTDEPGENSPTPTQTPEATVTSAPTPTAITIKPPSIASPPTCDSLKPKAPVLTSVKKSGTQAVLKWTKVELATHYVIAYGLTPENLEFGVPNTGNVTTFTVASLNSSSTYYFTVYAVNNCMPSDGSTIISSVAGASSGTTGTTGTTELPATGISLPTIIGIFGGSVFIILAIILAL